jgi:hypothetical protein
MQRDRPRAREGPSGDLARFSAVRQRWRPPTVKHGDQPRTPGTPPAHGRCLLWKPSTPRHRRRLRFHDGAGARRRAHRTVELPRPGLRWTRCAERTRTSWLCCSTISPFIDSPVGMPATPDELRARLALQVRGRSPDGKDVWLNWAVRERRTRHIVGTMQPRQSNSSRLPVSGRSERALPGVWDDGGSVVLRESAS